MRWFVLAMGLVMGCDRSVPEAPTSQPVVGLPNAAQRAASTKTLPGLVLPEADRRHLAEIEHRALLLNRFGFPRLAEPLGQRVGSALFRVFSADATGQVFTWDDPRPLLDGGIVLRTAKGAGPKVDRNGMVEALLSLVEGFEGAPSVSFATRGLAPVKDAEYDGAWKGDARIRLAGPSIGGGLREILGELTFDFVRIPEARDVGAAAGWIRGMRIQELHSVVTQRPLMRDETTARGLRPLALLDNWTLPEGVARQPVPGGVYVSDIDVDGWHDVLVIDRTRVMLYRGLPGGRFEEITRSAGLQRGVRFSGTVAFADLDGDGLPDLVLGDRVYRNLGEGKFEDRTKTTNLFDGPGMGIALLDYDLDGRIDLYLVRSNRGQERQTSWLDGPGGPGNQLWRNLGGWRFKDVTAEVGASGGTRSTFTAATLDANDDGRTDLYVIGEFGPGALLLNEKTEDGVRFREHRLESEDGDFGSMGLTVGDIDNDGRTDIYTANMYSKAGRRVIDSLTEGIYEAETFRRIQRFITGSELYRHVGAPGGLTFERIGDFAGLKDVGWAYGPALADLDNDGDLDLYATAGFNSVSRRRPDG